MPDWLKLLFDGITAGATIILAMLTGLYAWFTHRLAKTTEQMARGNVAMIEATREMAGATSTLAREAMVQRQIIQDSYNLQKQQDLDSRTPILKLIPEKGGTNRETVHWKVPALPSDSPVDIQQIAIINCLRGGYYFCASRSSSKIQKQHASASEGAPKQPIEFRQEDDRSTPESVRERLRKEFNNVNVPIPALREDSRNICVVVRTSRGDVMVGHRHLNWENGEIVEEDIHPPLKVTEPAP